MVLTFGSNFVSYHIVRNCFVDSWLLLSWVHTVVPHTLYWILSNVYRIMCVVFVPFSIPCINHFSDVLRSWENWLNIGNRAEMFSLHSCGTFERKKIVVGCGGLKWVVGCHSGFLHHAVLALFWADFTAQTVLYVFPSFCSNGEIKK